MSHYFHIYISSSALWTECCASFPPDSHGVKSPEDAAAAAPASPGQAPPGGRLRAPCTAFLPRRHLPARRLHQALRHQEGERSARRMDERSSRRFCWQENELLD